MSNFVHVSTVKEESSHCTYKLMNSNNSNCQDYIVHDVVLSSDDDAGTEMLWTLDMDALTLMST